MSGFIALAGLLTLAVLIALLYPLLRRREGSPEAWRSGGLVAVLIVLGAAGLYPLWSTYNWHATAPAADTPAAMVGRLARRLEKQPDDLQGWLQLGRSYSVLQEFPLAVRAYERANTLSKEQNVEAAMGLGDAFTQLEKFPRAVRAYERANTLSKEQSPEAAMALGEALYNDGSSDLSGRAGRLFEQALALDPNSAKALFFSALAASERNELPLAKQRFERLLAANPPADVRDLIEQHIKALDATSKMAAGAPATRAAPSGATAVAAGKVVTVALRVTLAGAVASKAKQGAPLFVVARIPGQRGPPLAALRLDARFPQDVDLRSSDAVMGGGFTAGQQIEVEARIANGGSAISVAGDPFGTLRLKAGEGPRAALEINQLKP